MPDGPAPPIQDPAGTEREPSSRADGIVLRIVVSALEGMLAVLFTGFGVLMATFCDGDEAGSGLCDGTTPRETVMLVAILLFGAVLAGGAVASVWSPALDRRRVVYWIPAGALLVVAVLAAPGG